MHPTAIKASEARAICEKTQVEFIKSRDNKVYYILKAIYNNISNATKEFPPRYEIERTISKDEEKYNCMEFVIQDLKSAGYIAFVDDTGDNEPVLRISWGKTKE